MQLLDTDAVAPEHRVDAFRAAFDQASVPCRIEHLGPDERVHSRMHLWHFGAANLFTTDASGFRLVRTLGTCGWRARRWSRSPCRRPASAGSASSTCRPWCRRGS